MPTPHPIWVNSEQLDVIELLAARHRAGRPSADVKHLAARLGRRARRAARDLAAKGLVRQRQDGRVELTAAGQAVR